MKCKELAELDRQHAEKHFGKYSAGYTRALARGQEDRWQLRLRLGRCLNVLRTLDDLNCQCDAELLPSEIAAEIHRLINE